MQIHELNTFAEIPGGASFLAIDNGFDTGKISVNGLMSETNEKIDRKVNVPLTNNTPDYGNDGQLLRTRGNGFTEWTDVGLPTDEQTAQAVSDWLDAHPEATTTVQDGSITEVKLSDNLKNKVLNGYVVPEMFGAAGDGSTDDSLAFTNMFASGKSIVIPANPYYLSSKIFADDENIISNNGTFPNGNFILSKNIGEAVPSAKVFTYLPFATIGVSNDADFQSAAYDSTRDRIVLGFSLANNQSYVCVIGSDFSVTGMYNTVLAYHINDLTYNPITDKIYCATMDSTQQIAVINPESLAIEEYKSVGYAVSQISYDETNDIYYVHTDGAINVLDSSFTLLKSYPFTNSEISDVIGRLKSGNRPEELVNQGSAIIEGQFCLVTDMTEYATYERAFLAQFSYGDGSVKKLYGWTPIGYSEEVETIVKIGNTIFAFGYNYIPAKQLIITRLVLSETAAIEPLSILHDDGNLLFTKDGIGITSGRCEILEGGFIPIGDFVYVNLHIKFLTALTGNNYWAILNSLPRAESVVCLSASGASTRGVQFVVTINNSGVVTLHNTPAISVGDELYITGMYLRYLYNQGDR